MKWSPLSYPRAEDHSAHSHQQAACVGVRAGGRWEDQRVQRGRQTPQFPLCLSLGETTIAGTFSKARCITSTQSCHVQCQRNLGFQYVTCAIRSWVLGPSLLGTEKGLELGRAACTVAHMTCHSLPQSRCAFTCQAHFKTCVYPPWESQKNREIVLITEL